MPEKRVLILIPARFDSQRLPGKPLKKLSGKYLTQWVWEEAVKLKKEVDYEVEIAVVTDHEEVEKKLKAQGVQVTRLDDELESGSDRIYLAYERYFKRKDQWSLIVNVQGDEPLIESKGLCALIDFHLGSKVDVVTGYKKRVDEEGFMDSNCVKIAGRYENRVLYPLYFSRAPIPYSRDSQNKFGESWAHHLGIYSYRPDALKKLYELSPSTLELCERLEQLRLMEAGASFAALEFSGELQGVDTPEDLLRVEKILEEKRK